MDIPEIMPFLEPIKHSDPELEIVNVSNSSGMDGSNLDGSSMVFFTTPRDTKSMYISDVGEDPFSQNKSITISIPIYNNNEFHGILFNVISLKSLLNSIGNVKFAETGFAYVLSPNGDVIFYPDQDWVGMNIRDVSESEDMVRVFTDEILTKDNGYVSYMDENNQKMLTTFSTVPVKGWKVGVTAPHKEIYHEVNKSRLVSVSLIFSVMALVILISILVASYIATPIKYEAEHMGFLAKADFTHELPKKFLSRKDELGLLARSVDSMSKSIGSVLHNVISEAQCVMGNAKISSQNLADLALEIENVTATTEQMSAEIEETAALTEQSG